MPKIELALLTFVIALSASVHADSVWEQMQRGSTNSEIVAVKITALEVASDHVTFTTSTGHGKKAIEETKTASLCERPSQPMGNEIADSDVRRTAFVTERIQLLKEAFRNGDLVELKYQGPWNPCIESVRIVKKHA